jgi:hypothetical protein
MPEKDGNIFARPEESITSAWPDTVVTVMVEAPNIACGPSGG